MSSPARSGFLHRSWVDDQGRQYPYMVFVPHSMQPSDRLPLIVYLNGVGECGHDGILPMRNGLAHAVWENERDFPFLVAWPQCEVGELWSVDSPSTERALKITQAVLAEFHGDADRVSLTGISGGGSGTWAVGSSHPETFAALVPVSGHLNVERAQAVAHSGLPLWMFCVQEDGLELLESNREVYRELLKHGASPRLTVLRTHGNRALDAHDAWDFAFRERGLFRWLSQQHRPQVGDTTTEYEVVPLATIGEASTASDAESRRLAASSSAGTSLIRTNFSGRAVSELHLEFLASDTLQRFSVGWVGTRPAEDESEEFLTISLSDLNAGGVGPRDIGPSLVPLDPLAEQALHSGAWNDLRMSWTERGLTAELNGWPICQDVASRAPPGDSVLAFSVVGPVDSFTDVKNLRIRHAQGLSAHRQATFNAPDPLDREQVRATGAEATPSVASILSTWKQRELSLPAVQLSWTSEEGRCGNSESITTMDSAVVPSKLASTHQMQISGQGFQCAGVWPHRRVDIGSATGVTGHLNLVDYQRAYDARFDGTVQPPPARSFEVRADSQLRSDIVTESEMPSGRGIVYRGADVWKSRIGELDDLVWRGPLLAIRPTLLLGESLQHEGTCELGSFAWVGGARCAVLEQSIPNEKSSHLLRRFWVDIARGGLILRAAVLVNGHLHEQIDLQYSHNADQVWVPAAWTAVVRSPVSKSMTDYRYPGKEWMFHGARARGVECQLSRSALPLRPVAQLAPRTIVYDQRVSKWVEQMTDQTQRTLTQAEGMAMVMGQRVEQDGAQLYLRWAIAALILFFVGHRVLQRYRSGV